MRRRQAFTLVELIVTLAIVVILAAIAIPVYNTVQAQAQIKADIAEQNVLVQALSSYYAVNGCYPNGPRGTGNMPTNLGPYVGNTWPGNMTYVTFMNGGWVNSSSGAVNYVGVLANSVLTQSGSWTGGTAVFNGVSTGATVLECP
ncbi:MAG TPA: type II secretion system protein [bacterium]|nr:type II secretion system protein [bacterium]